MEPMITHKQVALLKDLISRKDVQDYYSMGNMITIERHNTSPHDINHAIRVAYYAIVLSKCFDRLSAKSIFETEKKLSNEDCKSVLLAAAILHDIGNIVDRDTHPLWSGILARDILQRVFLEYYNEERGYLMTSATLHAITSHGKRGHVPKTLEAKILSLADRIDVTKERVRGYVYKEIHYESARHISKIETKLERDDLYIIIRSTSGRNKYVRFREKKIKDEIKRCDLTSLVKVLVK